MSSLVDATDSTRCPDCGSYQTTAYYGGERGEGPPFLVCGVCGWDGQERPPTPQPDALHAAVEALTRRVEALERAEQAKRARALDRPASEAQGQGGYE